MVAGWSTTNRSWPCALSSVIRARSLVSSFGSALLYRRFPGPIESDGVMMAFTYVNADEDIDGVMFLVFLHRNVYAD
jgi:hypothetical protein